MKLSDVCEFIVDCPHSTAPDEGAGYPLIRTPNIGRGRLNLNGVHRVSEKIYLQRTQRGIPQKNDLILAREAPAGNVAIIKNEGKVCLGQRTVLIRPLPDKANPDYLTYYLLSPQQQYNLLGTANGATVAHVNLSTIRNLKIQLPPINIQCHIVDILSVYDDLIEVNQKQIRLLEEAARRLYREWFVDLRFPGHEDTPITDGIPAGWYQCKLSDAIDFNPSVSLKKGQIKQSVPMSALSTSSMVLNTKEFTDTYSNSGSHFQNADTLLARITPCLENGKTAFVMGLSSTDGAVGSTEFIVMRSKTLNPYMVYLLARTPAFRQTAISCMLGSDGRQRVNLHTLEIMNYLHPTHDLIQQFQNMAEPFFYQIYYLAKQCRLAAEARDFLLPKLMNGEIEV